MIGQEGLEGQDRQEHGASVTSSIPPALPFPPFLP